MNQGKDVQVPPVPNKPAPAIPQGKQAPANRMSPEEVINKRKANQAKGKQTDKSQIPQKPNKPAPAIPQGKKSSR